MAIITPTTCTVLRPRLAKRVGTFRWSKRWSLRDLRTRIPDAGKIRRASPPSSSLERDFCRRRLARQKGPEDDVSAQRPEIGDHHMREMAAKTAFLLASYQLRVSGDCAPGLEPRTR